MEKQKVYLSGKISGTDDYMERFSKAQKELELRGYDVVNPALVNAALPEDTSYADYMRMGITMLDMCDVIYMLKGWQSSRGARYELEHAVINGKKMVYEEE